MAAKTLTIDGKQITAEQGTTLLQAAKENGITIPTLCHLDGVYDVGACRLCLVEVAGIKDILTKCIGTSNPHNVIHATVNALQQLRDPHDAAKRRGKTLEEITNA